tara:strand:+ start:215 stop:826 length:612 start_codon:yes stop_codon:yes gene_type:complete
VVALVALPAALGSVATLFYGLCVVAAVLGLAYHPLFFATHLLDIVNFSPGLQNVLRAVTTNGRSLTIVTLFALVVTYCFAALALASDVSVDFADGNRRYGACYDLASCWKLVLLDGMRHGDIGDALLLRNPSDPPYVYQALYSFAFWLLDRDHDPAQPDLRHHHRHLRRAARRRARAPHRRRDRLLHVRPRALDLRPPRPLVH